MATAHTSIGGIARENYVDVIVRWIGWLFHNSLLSRHKKKHSNDGLFGQVNHMHDVGSRVRPARFGNYSLNSVPV
jgi:hypothetical protein